MKLTWQIPDNIPDEFLRPLEVSIQKVENDIYRDVITIGNEGTFAEGIAIDANKRYRFVVKLVGNLTDVITIGNEGTFAEGIAIDANKRYRFVVKLVGNLTDEVVETGISSRIYSDSL